MSGPGQATPVARSRSRIRSRSRVANQFPKANVPAMIALLMARPR